MLGNYLSSYFNLVAIDKYHAVLARARGQEWNALRRRHHAGGSCHAVAGEHAEDTAGDRAGQDEKRRQTKWAKSEQTSTRQVAENREPA